MRDSLWKVLAEKCLLAPGCRIVLGLSGGGDSVALLHLLRDLAPRYPLTLLAAHLDHAIRPESREDAAFVQRLCSELDVPFVSERVDVPVLAREGGLGLEEGGRKARRAFLERVAADWGGAVIALAHHRGDQVETVLHRLVRGSGLSGLSAMRFRSGLYIRPLLDCRREDLRQYLAAHDLQFLEDASNRDPVFTRNRIRHELLPQLAAYNPRIEEHLARLAGRVAEEEEFWRDQEERVLAELSSCDAGVLRLGRPRLLALHPALRRRVLRRALGQVRGDLREIASVHIEALNDLLCAERPQAERHLPGVWAAVRYELLILATAPPSPGPAPELSIAGPGVYRLADGRVLHVTLEDSVRGEGPDVVEFAASLTPFPLLVRTFRPGDRFRPSGMEGRKKLKDFLIETRIDRERRAAWPLVVGAEILWVAGLRRCEGRRPSASSGRVLRLVLSNPGTPTIAL